MRSQNYFSVVCAAMVVLAGPMRAQEAAPAISIADYLHQDGSRTRALGFETVPGVLYSVESSDALSTWVQEFEVYGLGQTQNVPMVWIEAPDQTPPDPPAGGEELGQFVSLIMKSSSAPEGGAILSWRSLDGGTALTTLVAATPGAAWAACPISLHNYGGYAFFIMVSNAEAPPSGELPPLDSLDQDMIDAFVANFAAMDLDMAAGNGVSATTPDPGPVDAGERNFWRVEADWSLDSDHDGSPDWAELAIAADASHPYYALADAFNGDRDGDSEPDGKSIDTDGDGVKDDKEPTMRPDRVIDWVKEEQPRYAAFPFVGPAPDAGEEPAFPHQINDLGMVLFDEGVWDRGHYFPLEMEGTDVTATKALGMNNQGEIVGLGVPKVQGRSVITLGPLVWWDSRTVAPIRVERPAEDPDDGMIDSGSVWPEMKADRAFDCLVDDERRFVGESSGVEHENRRSVWQRVPGQDFGLMDAPSEVVENTLEPDITWGIEGGQTKIYSGSGETPIEERDGTGLRLSYRPSDRLGLFFTNGPVHGEVVGGDWEVSTVMWQGLDVCSQGLFIRHASQLWVNNCMWELTDVAYGLGAPWDVNPEMFDLSPNGWLAARKPGTAGSPMQCLAAMPVVLLDEDDEQGFATGVDHHSANCRKPDLAKVPPEDPNEGQARYWAMVPIGRDGDDKPLCNTVRFLTPASAANPVTLSATGVTFDVPEVPEPGVDYSKVVLNQPEQPVKLTVEGGVNSTQDVDVTFSIETETETGTKVSNAASHPVGFRIMKKRVVKLTIYHIGLEDPETGDVEGPDLEFTKETLENHLNGLFGKQVNAYWDVTVHGLTAPAGVNWDIGDGDAAPEDDGFGAPAGSEPHPGNGDFDIGGLDPGPEQKRIMKARSDTRAHITGYIVGGLDPGDSFKAWTVRDGKHKSNSANGTTSFGDRAFWVNGAVERPRDGETEAEAKERTHKDRLKTIAHEIGHVMLNYGHPDKEDWERVHPLKGSKVEDRLMSQVPFKEKFFGVAVGRRKLLVKGEWNEIEDWMATIVDAP